MTHNRRAQTPVGKLATHPSPSATENRDVWIGSGPDSGQGLNHPSLRLPLWSPHCPASVCTTRLQSQSPHQPTWSLLDSCFHSHKRQLRLGGVASRAHVQGWPVAEPGLEPLSHSPSPSRCTLRACPCSSFPASLLPQGRSGVGLLQLRFRGVDLGGGEGRGPSPSFTGFSAEIFLSRKSPRND